MYFMVIQHSTFHFCWNSASFQVEIFCVGGAFDVGFYTPRWDRAHLQSVGKKINKKILLIKIYVIVRNVKDY